MEALISYVVVILIVFSIIRKKKRKLEGDTDIAKARQEAARNIAGNARSVRNTVSSGNNTAIKQTGGRKNTGVNPNMATRSFGTITKDGKVSSSLRDDRNNDWLANQMREERNALFRLREMFGFQMQGKNLSDAELLKEFHMQHCDAERVDRASGK